MNPISISYPSSKTLTIIGGLILSLGSVGVAIFLQYYYDLNPCPLCIFSRIILIFIGSVYFIWLIQHLIFKKSFDWPYFYFIALVLISGLGLSGYHLWLMYLPPEKLPACGPDLSYLLETLPLNEVIVEVFRGSGNCAHDTWRLWGLLSIPQLELGIYLLLAGLQLYFYKLLKR